jgi:hypothetical protein
LRKFFKATTLKDLDVRACLAGDRLSEGCLQRGTVSLGEALGVDVFWSLTGCNLMLGQTVCVTGGGLHLREGPSLVVRIVVVVVH